MNPDLLTSNAALSRLLDVLTRSLPTYVSYALPWVGKGDELAADALQEIAADQRRLSERVSELIIDRGGVMDTGTFPVAFPGYHDLSVTFLVRKSLELQQRDVERIRACFNELDGDDRASALAERALNESLSHRQRLETLAHGGQESAASPAEA